MSADSAGGHFTTLGKHFQVSDAFFFLYLPTFRVFFTPSVKVLQNDSIWASQLWFPRKAIIPFFPPIVRKDMAEVYIVRKCGGCVQRNDKDLHKVGDDTLFQIRVHCSKESRMSALEIMKKDYWLFSRKPESSSASLVSLFFLLREYITTLFHFFFFFVGLNLKRPFFTLIRIPRAVQQCMLVTEWNMKLGKQIVRRNLVFPRSDG